MTGTDMSKAELMREVKRLRAALQQQRTALEQHRDLQALVEELGTLQEETRVQNEQLMSIQHSLEESRDRYADLYDWAPVAYVTLDPSGFIVDINLTGSALLEQVRSKILRTPLSAYVV